MYLNGQENPPTANSGLSNASIELHDLVAFSIFTVLLVWNSSNINSVEYTQHKEAFAKAQSKVFSAIKIQPIAIEAVKEIK